ncbi:hypothetical protein CCP3SC1_420012 [Gammaproteobacteria bacterium]
MAINFFVLDLFGIFIVFSVLATVFYGFYGVLGIVSGDSRFGFHRLVVITKRYLNNF